MLAKIESRTVLGIEAKKVEVEVDMSGGLPCFTIVGLPDAAVRESRDRVVSAIKNCGFKFPPKKITINLAPADLRKEGAAFDLAIAVGILVSNGDLEQGRVAGKVFCGELSLDGGLRPVNGALPIAIGISENGGNDFILPSENAKEAAIVSGISVFPAKDLGEVVDFLKGKAKIEPLKVDLAGTPRPSGVFDIDFSDVKGQWHVKRGLEVAAAGGHNVLMIGPPGSGKTMLAQRLVTILPGLSFGEMLETTKIHSVAGLLDSKNFLVSRRPFRMPHHTVSYAGLVGGGKILKPGEISLAHNGVLFLDELPEFHRDALEALRQPLEGGTITVSRAAYNFSYPAKFMLVAAMNPCPCGYFTDPKKECHCAPPAIQRYLSKVSGPLLDRIDIHLEVPSLRYKELSNKSRGESSADIKERVDKARKMQGERYEGLNIFCNAHLSSKHLEQFCRIDKEAAELLKLAILELGLSARGYDKVLKISRTVADLAGADTISAEHISEAINYRSLDRNLGF
ncbi:MAG: YifB family Mg chelatase-like AAA ATPase [Candidatus Omnitrophica bacterium]|nr:YifB family Mg chelatase-like AAA ATPase [Candidatus Omnitrophota bacterium]